MVRPVPAWTSFAASSRLIVSSSPSAPQSVAWLLAVPTMSKPIDTRSSTIFGSPSIQVPPDSACGAPLKVGRSKTTSSKLPKVTSARRRMRIISGERFSIVASIGRK